MRLALALALLLAVAAPARAATIRTIPQTCDRAGCSGGYSVFEAAPGERNDVRVTRDGARPGLRAAVPLGIAEARARAGPLRDLPHPVHPAPVPRHPVRLPARDCSPAPVPCRRFTLRRRTGRVTVRLAEPYCRRRGYEISATFRQGPERSTITWRLPALR